MLMTKLSLLFILCVSVCYCEMKTTESLVPIASAFECSDNDTLVLIDIGGTLLAFRDPLLHKSHEKWTREWFTKNCPNITKEETTKLVRIVEAATENWLLVDEKWPETIIKAQNRGAKVIAFTKVSGLKGNRANKLAAFDLIINNDLPELSSGSSFEYSDGVLETECPLKGPVLEEVLQKINAKPKKIIFVDDRLEQIESVEEICHKHGIQSISFHYTATKAAPELDTAVADYQLHTLVKEHRWVPAEKAKADSQE